MNTHAAKAQENRTQPAVGEFSKKQGTDSAFQFVDNRSEAVAQRRLQEMANRYAAQQLPPVMPLNHGYPDMYAPTPVQMRKLSNRAVLQLARGSSPGHMESRTSPSPFNDGAKAGVHGPVVQRQKITLSFPQLSRLGIEKNSFAAYLKKLGFTYDEKTRELDTGDSAMTVTKFSADYQVFKEQYKKSEEEAVVQPEELRAYGEHCVRQRFDGAEITALVQIGKNNFGIYQIIGVSEKPLIVKVLGSGYTEKGLTETAEVTNALKERYAKSQVQGKFEINTLRGIEPCTDGRLNVTLAIFEEQGVMSLDDALLHQDLDIGTLVGAARGLADRTARFHFAPVAEDDTEDGSYLFHGDLNTSNIMLDFEGIMGLIDNDDLKKTDDPRHLMWDISSLLTTMHTTLKERYPPDGVKDEVNVFEQMRDAFKSQYVKTMSAMNVPQKDTIIALMK